MSPPIQTAWRMAGEEAGSCNCAWGCPCQFNALPTHGGAIFEIFAAVCPQVLPTVFAPITFQSDRERRQALVHIPGLGDIRTEPIKNPVTGEEHRARIVLPNGFEHIEAEMGNAVTLRVQSSPPLMFEHTNTHAQLNAFDWSNG